jgi:hypothetical protein
MDDDGAASVVRVPLERLQQQGRDNEVRVAAAAFVARYLRPTTRGGLVCLTGCALHQVPPPAPPPPPPLPPCFWSLSWHVRSCVCSCPSARPPSFRWSRFTTSRTSCAHRSSSATTGCRLWAASSTSSRSSESLQYTCGTPSARANWQAVRQPPSHHHHRHRPKDVVAVMRGAHHLHESVPCEQPVERGEGDGSHRLVLRL